MKRWIGAQILTDEFQGSSSGRLLRKVIRGTRNLYSYNPWFLLDTQALERPNYAYCMLHAARLAQKLGLDRISALEFGVAGGNGPYISASDPIISSKYIMILGRKCSLCSLTRSNRENESIVDDQ